MQISRRRRARVALLVLFSSRKEGKSQKFETTVSVRRQQSNGLHQNHCRDVDLKQNPE